MCGCSFQLIPVRYQCNSVNHFASPKVFRHYTSNYRKFSTMQDVTLAYDWWGLTRRVLNLATVKQNCGI